MTSDDPQQRRAPRPPGKVTAAYVERAALAYLERFASSADNLRRVLTRKVERRCRLREEEPEPFLPLVDDVVRLIVASGLVDDRRYAEARTASLRRRGGSAQLIVAKLAAKGVEREVAAAALAGRTRMSAPPRRLWPSGVVWAPTEPATARPTATRTWRRWCGRGSTTAWPGASSTKKAKRRSAPSFFKRDRVRFSMRHAFGLPSRRPRPI